MESVQVDMASLSEDAARDLDLGMDDPVGLALPDGATTPATPHRPLLDMNSLQPIALETDDAMAIALSQRRTVPKLPRCHVRSYQYLATPPLIHYSTKFRRRPKMFFYLDIGHLFYLVSFQFSAF